MAGNILSHHHLRLAPDLVEKSVFLKVSLPLAMASQAILASEQHGNMMIYGPADLACDLSEDKWTAWRPPSERALNRRRFSSLFITKPQCWKWSGCFYPHAAKMFTNSTCPLLGAALQEIWMLTYNEDDVQNSDGLFLLNAPFYLTSQTGFAHVTKVVDNIDLLCPLFL